MESVDVQSINKRMDKFSAQMDSMQKTLEQIAVQNEQIRQLQDETSALRSKMDKLTANDGVITNMQQFQASCPRRHIWAMWLVVLPMGLALLQIAFSGGCF